jgi:hypothetical protein
LAVINLHVVRAWWYRGDVDTDGRPLVIHFIAVDSTATERHRVARESQDPQLFNMLLEQLEIVEYTGPK